MDQRKMKTVCRYFYTIARRNGLSRITLGLFLISGNKLLVINKDGRYCVPKIGVEGGAIDRAMGILAEQHKIDEFKILNLIDGITDEDSYRLNFAVSGKVSTGKHSWVEFDELSGNIRNTMRKYFRKNVQKKEFVEF